VQMPWQAASRLDLQSQTTGWQGSQQHVYWDHDPAALAVHISTFGASVSA